MKNKTSQSKIVKDFGNEWERFNQIDLDKNELIKIYNDYFKIFPWHKLRKNSVGIDIGCGTGRWSYITSDKFKRLTLLDGSQKSINSAKEFLKDKKNIDFIVADICSIPIPNNKFDFGYSLGVLHHIPNVNKALKEIYRVLKPNSPILFYFYYNFENKPMWYKQLWYFSNLGRFIISRFPKHLKNLICDLIALMIYFPLAKISLFLSKFFNDMEKFPLSYYRSKSFYTMRTDALDRFGTTYEKRYSKSEIEYLLNKSGFKKIKFSNIKPFWCVLAYKR